jgi:hypothetical protein
MGHIRKGRIIIMPPHPYAQHTPTHSEPTHQRDSRFSYSRLMTFPVRKSSTKFARRKEENLFQKKILFFDISDKTLTSKEFFTMTSSVFLRRRQKIFLGPNHRKKSILCPQQKYDWIIRMGRNKFWCWLPEKGGGS